jgi:4-hydroxy-tetrahydrodipicolinate synthase
MFHGVYAAVVTPRFVDESVDEAGLSVLIRFLMGKGISRFALNGATGEFCLTTPEQLRVLLRTVREAGGGTAEMLCGVGAPGTAGAVALAEVAQEEGASGLLLPMPFFFPYGQEDLDLFARVVAGSTELPVLLYNLPQFTSGLEVRTVRRLIAEVGNIVGIKDSSGRLDILRDLTEAGVGASRIVGNDSALAPAMSEGVCDGVVSGVACAVPELILDLWAEKAGSEGFARAAGRLSEFIGQLDGFPTPWGLKFALEARGIVQAGFAQPVTEQRRAQGRKMAAGLGEWLG